MAYIPQKTTSFYNNHKEHDVVFNKEVIKNLGLLIHKVILKCIDKSFPCILYQTSMIAAKVLSPLGDAFFQNLKQANNLVSLHLVFLSPDSKREIPLFINAKVDSYNPYQGATSHLYFVSLNYLNKPPDDFINIIGQYFEHKLEPEKRQAERIVISSKNEMDFGIQPMDTFLFINGKGRKCILSELSVTSAKVVISGIVEEFENKRAIAIMKIKALKEVGEVVGDITRCEPISEQDGIISLILVFDETMMPPSYKMWIKECIEAIKKRK